MEKSVGRRDLNTYFNELNRVVQSLISTRPVVIEITLHPLLRGKASYPQLL